MYLVTGGAGFIGSHIVRALNARGNDDVVVVDDLRRGEKFANLRDCRIADYLDKEELAAAIEAGGRGLEDVRCVLHQGACTDTLQTDGRYLMRNNFTFSKALLGWALERGLPFVYASSAAIYGRSTDFVEAPDNERPINPYGYSKLAFDQYVRRVLPGAATTVVGLRYFNVYGPRERQKGRMASMVYQLHGQLEASGQARLFEGTDGYADGEQRRDFVHVDDVVRVNLFFAEGPPRRGLFNVGTGSSWTFNAVARLLIERLGRGEIAYVPFAEHLRGKYQSYTQADLTALRGAGYDADFLPLEEGLPRCVAEWAS